MLDFVDYRISIPGFISLEIENRSFALCADEILEHWHLQKLPRTLALLHDAGNPEVVIQNLDRISHPNVFRFGEQVINQHIIWPSKRAPGNVAKRTGESLITVQINSGNHLNCANS